MRRRKLGQHYLVDPEVIEEMVSAAEIRPSESVVEIGTGRGALTERLVGLGKSLEGYEVDSGNYQKTLAKVGKGRATLHLADAFEARPTFDVLVSSLPYSRSLDFVEWISQRKYDRAVVLLQEDFVDKLLSPPGSRDYRAVSAIAQISSSIMEIGRVSRAAFDPPPRVNSLLLSVRPILSLSEPEIVRIKRLFSLRRREVSSVLAELKMKPEPRYGRRRVYSLSPQEVHGICG